LADCRTHDIDYEIRWCVSEACFEEKGTLEVELFDALLVIGSVIAAGVATLSGFGIGSIVTPILAAKMDIELAVAVISIPHLIATSLRCWMLRKYVNKQVLLKFGSWSAVGGLVGALFHGVAGNPVLTIVLSLLLVYVGAAGLLGWSQNLAFEKKWSSIVGVFSGLLGGLVGNQGGIRSAALLGLDLQKEELIGTATAVGVMVDLARLPVYAYTAGAELQGAWKYIALSTAGCLLGTFVGKTLLSKIPEIMYRKVLFLMLCVLGVYLCASAIH